MPDATMPTVATAAVSQVPDLREPASAPSIPSRTQAARIAASVADSGRIRFGGVMRLPSRT
jgi:hypothetical protein